MEALNATRALRKYPLWPLRLAALLCAAVTVYMYFPGGMGNDQRAMLEQAQSGKFHAWHGYTVPFLWKLGLLIAPGPVSMHLLNVALYFTGYYLLAASAMVARRPGLAWAITGLGLLPLTHILLIEGGSKDALLTAFLLVAFGCAVRAVGSSSWPRGGYLLVSVLMLALSVGIRQNAFFAVVPLAAFLGLALNPPRRKRLVVAAMAMSVFVTLGAAVGFRAAIYSRLKFEPSNVLLSLLIFDLAAIAASSGEDPGAGLFGDDFVTRARDCYTPFWWDEFSAWGRCSSVWKNFTGELQATPFDEAALKDRRERALSAWMRAVLAHPKAYVRHRYIHFLYSIRVRCAYCQTPLSTIEHFVDHQSTGRPYPLLTKAADKVTHFLAGSIFGRPWLWLSLIVLMLAGSYPLRRDPLFPWLWALGLSGLLYALGFTVLGVAGLVRYFHWSIVCGLLACAVFVSAMLQRWHGRLPWSRRALPESPPPPVSSPPG